MAIPGTAAVTPERLMQMAWGYAPPLMMETAIRHGIFDNLDAGPKTAAQLAAAAKVPERGIRMVANALTSLRLLAKDSAGQYSLTPESATFLVSSKPSFMGGMIRHTSAQTLPLWLGLNQTVAGGKPERPVNQQNGGVEFFQQFVEDLFPLSYPAAQVLAGALGLATATAPVSVLDIAAGSGVWSIALAHASPMVKVTAVDWPGVLDVTRKVTARCGVADRYTFVEGDMHTANAGTGHNVATLGHILHSEGEAASRLLLKHVFDALAPGGTIAIQEFLVDDERATNTMGLIFAVNMLVATDVGDTFSFNEIAAWLRECGFENPRTMEAPGPSPLILATKPA